MVIPPLASGRGIVSMNIKQHVWSISLIIPTHILLHIDSCAVRWSRYSTDLIDDGYISTSNRAVERCRHSDSDGTWEIHRFWNVSVFEMSIVNRSMKFCRSLLVLPRRAVKYQRHFNTLGYSACIMTSWSCALLRDAVIFAVVMTTVRCVSMLTVILSGARRGALSFREQCAIPACATFSGPRELSSRPIHMKSSAMLMDDSVSTTIQVNDSLHCGTGKVLIYAYMCCCGVLTVSEILIYSFHEKNKRQQHGLYHVR